MIFLEMGEVFGTIYLVWPWTMILPISASQLARITGVNHQCLAEKIEKGTYKQCVSIIQIFFIFILPFFFLSS
jgi:hypothetical protein